MCPGQLHPNEFEQAILDRIAQECPSLRSFMGHLHVLSREFTGVGSYTHFKCDKTGSELDAPYLVLEPLILMPDVPNGMSAVIHCESGMPTCLEVSTFGGEHWDGVFDGFRIEEAAEPTD